MWKMTILTALRMLRRNRLHAVVTITSLAVGMTCFVLFYFSWQYERSFDRYHPGAGRIYRVNRSIEVNPGRPMIADQVGALAPALTANLPEVEAATRWYQFPDAVTRREGGELRPVAGVYAVDDQFFKVFPIRALAGDTERALSNRASILLSRRTAGAVFGDEDALGKPLKLAVLDRSLMRFRQDQGSTSLWDERSYDVAAILPDPPSNSTFAFDVLIPIEAAAGLYEEAGYESVLSTWGYGWATTFARLRPGAALAGLAGKIDLLKAANTPAQPKEEEQIKELTVLAPLVGLHLADAASVKYLYIFGTIASIVLLLACFNAVNLTTSRVFSRSREIGLKKVAGASRRQLIIHFLTESLLACVAALVLALAAVSLLIPVFRYLSGRGLVLAEIGLGPLAVGLAAIVLFAAAVSGGYPAYLLSAVKPVDLFTKHRTPGTSRSSIRKGLVFAQFGISGILLIMTLAVSRQMSFIRQADLGMNVDGVAILRLDSQVASAAGVEGVLKEDLLKSVGIAAVSALSEVPPAVQGEIQVKPGGRTDAEKSAWRHLSTDHDFLDVFRIRLKEGRFFSRDFPSDRKNSAVINESAARLLGPGPALGKTIQAIVQKVQVLRFDFTVVGVVEDFHTRPLHDAMEPLLILLGDGGFGSMAVKMEPGREPAGMDAIRDRWRTVVPDSELRLSLLKEDVGRAYGNEERLMALTRGFAEVAVFIGCIGLFGLAAFGTAQRRKEIGIRKVLGASPSRLFGAFAGEFAKPVFLSNLAAWPVAFFLARSWLREFAYRATLPVWIFIAGGAAVLAFALLAIGGQLVRAARENPIESLRQE